MAPVLELRGISKRFRGLRVLDGLSFALDEGERCGLIGPNGSGKTTLINIIAGSLRPDAGTIAFRGVDITEMPGHRRARLGIARSFQIPRPFRTMTVAENLRIPLEYAAVDGDGAADPMAAARRVLDLIGLGAKADTAPRDLSQVEMRKLELARALAAKPKLLLLDEALAGLSTAEVDEIVDILLTLNRGGMAIVMIEHVMRAVMRFSERVVVLNAGVKIADGSRDRVVRDPDVERAYLGE